MAYMAPEILAKRGYTYTIDWWSLGVCAYELTFGRRPFRGRTNSDLTYSISKDPLKYPEDAEKKCSRTGLQVLKGVRMLSVFSNTSNSNSSSSYLIEILRNVLGVNLTERATRNCEDTSGSKLLIGRH